MGKCLIPLSKSVLPSRMDAEGKLEKCCSHAPLPFFLLSSFEIKKLAQFLAVLMRKSPWGGL